MNLELDFMSDKEYKKTKNDVKIAIITPKGKILITNTSHDGKRMRDEYQLKQYTTSDTCKYHIDYLVVLLNKHFKHNPKYQKYLKIKDPMDVYNILNLLLLDGNIIFINNTCYNNIMHLLHGSNGELLINYPTMTYNQQLSLPKLEYYLETINNISIKKFSDYPTQVITMSTQVASNITNLVVEQGVSKKLTRNQAI